MIIEVITIERIAKKKASIPNTKILNNTMTASVQSKPIDGLKPKYFLNINGGIVVPPLEASIL